MRKFLLVLVVIFGLACVFLFVRRGLTHQLELTSYFADAQGLHPGATVRLAGVDIGRVTSVRVRPELHENPVEIKMVFLTDYDLKISSDSTVSLATDGLLGQTYVRIDPHGASGPPVENHGTLKSTSSDITQNAFKQLSDALDKLHCGPEPDDRHAMPQKPQTGKRR